MLIGPCASAAAAVLGRGRARMAVDSIAVRMAVGATVRVIVCIRLVRCMGVRMRIRVWVWMRVCMRMRVLMPGRDAMRLRPALRRAVLARLIRCRRIARAVQHRHHRLAPHMPNLRSALPAPAASMVIVRVMLA